jgi:hypothetical protein
MPQEPIVGDDREGIPAHIEKPSFFERRALRDVQKNDLP